MKTILVILALTFSVQAKADLNQFRAMQGALDARNEFVSALIKKDYVKVTHDGFEHAIQVLAEELNSRNDPQMADQLMNLWNNNEAVFFSLTAMKDLGDHAVLFPWLENFLGQMASKYGDVIYKLPIVSDLRMLNFAIPVVFSPHGTWQTAGVDSRIEYRKHFIPFANLITYYAANYGCQVVAKKYNVPQAKQLCEKVADKLKFAMGRYIAPVVSDWIFRATDRHMMITDDQLYFVTPSDLASAIQGVN